MPTKQTKLTIEQKIQYMIDNWENMSAQELADKLRVTIYTIYNWRNSLQKAGLELESKRRKRVDWKAFRK